MDNLIYLAMQAMQSGQSPQQFLQAQSQNNPQLQQIMQMIQGKTPEQIWQTVNNYAQSTGQDIGAIRQQLGV